MQHSGLFVLYKHITETESVYYTTHNALNSPSHLTPALQHATVMPKMEAFTLAQHLNAHWSVGEMVSDEHGLRVEM